MKRKLKTIETIFTNPCARAGYDSMSIFKRSLTGLNSEFSFSLTSCLTKAEEPSLPYYLLIAGGRIIGFIPFPRVLVLCEMLSVSSRIWTCVVVSISDDDHHYTTTITITPRPPRGCPRGVMVKAMNCGIVVREFVLQSRYYVHFRANTLGKGMNPLILPPAMGK